MTWHGQGASVLMLPALSSISTRSEMWPLQERLGPWFTTLAIDWAGFGDRPRPPLRWSPKIYRSFLAYLLTEVAPRPFATIAAGHAAAYCLDAAAARPGSTGRLCLIAPTWRGPLPTMMGRKHPMFAQISRIVDWPVVGDFLYRLNVNRFMVRKMALVRRFRSLRHPSPIARFHVPRHGRWHMVRTMPPFPPVAGWDSIPGSPIWHRRPTRRPGRARPR